MKIEYYTDGSCRNNGSENAVGAYGYIVIANQQIQYQFVEKELNTTNQRCELLAALRACQHAANAIPWADIVIYSDSAYLINCWKQKWYEKWLMNDWRNSQKQAVANQDLWEQLIPFFDNVNYTFVKVKGHAGVEYNEVIDQLVQAKSLEGN